MRNAKRVWIAGAVGVVLLTFFAGLLFGRSLGGQHYYPSGAMRTHPGYREGKSLRVEADAFVRGSDGYDALGYLRVTDKNNSTVWETYKTADGRKVGAEVMWDIEGNHREPIYLFYYDKNGKYVPLLMHWDGDGNLDHVVFPHDKSPGACYVIRFSFRGGAYSIFDQYIEEPDANVEETEDAGGANGGS